MIRNPIRRVESGRSYDYDNLPAAANNTGLHVYCTNCNAGSPCSVYSRGVDGWYVTSTELPAAAMAIGDKPAAGTVLNGDAIKTNQIARFLFNEGTGAFAKNLVTSSNVALHGSPSWTATGEDNGPALTPSSATQGLDLGSISGLSGSYSAFFRFKITSDSETYTLLNDWDAVNKNIIIFIASGVVQLYSGNGTSQNNTTGPTLAEDTIYNLVITRSGGALKIYLDGAEYTSVTGFPTGYATSISRYLFNESGWSSGLKGQIEEAILWSRAITSDEVIALQDNPYLGVG